MFLMGKSKGYFVLSGDIFISATDLLTIDDAHGKEIAIQMDNHIKCTRFTSYRM